MSSVETLDHFIDILSGVTSEEEYANGVSNLTHSMLADAKLLPFAEKARSIAQYIKNRLSQLNNREMMFTHRDDLLVYLQQVKLELSNNQKEISADQAFSISKHCV